MDELARLRWQCRRGSLELDLILEKYLETRYLVADVEEKARFVDLLKLDDGELLGVLMGELEVETGKMKFLVEKIWAFTMTRV
jgi:antitoxin CptB